MALFKDPPPKEDCPIFFLPMPARLLSCVSLPNATRSSVSIYDFGHPANTTLSCVCDMTSDVSRHVADMTQNVAVWATKSTRRHPTCGAKDLKKAKFHNEAAAIWQVTKRQDTTLE